MLRQVKNGIQGVTFMADYYSLADVLDMHTKEKRALQDQHAKEMREIQKTLADVEEHNRMVASNPDNGRCASCIWWKRDTFPSPDWGECLAMETGNAKPLRNPNSMALALGADGNIAGCNTWQGFGCVMWEKKGDMTTENGQ